MLLLGVTQTCQRVLFFLLCNARLVTDILLSIFNN